MDSDELTQWYLERRADLLGTARRIVGSRADADDVVQDAWIHAAAIDPATVRQPAAWLAAAARNRSIDVVRRRRAGERLIDALKLDAATTRARPTGPDATVALREEAAAALARLVGTSSEADAAALVLCDVFGEDFATIARSMRLSAGAVRVRVHRARRRVRDRLDLRDDAATRSSVAFAVCWRAIVDVDAGPLHAFLHETAVATNAAVALLVDADSTASAGSVPPIRVALGHIGGRYVLVLRQGTSLICALPVGPCHDEAEAVATVG